MPAQASLRKSVLLAIYRRSAGNVTLPIQLADLAKALKLPEEDVVILTGQLEAKAFVHYIARAKNPPSSLVAITMRGIEECERMERGRFRAFYEDHFALTGVIFLILSVILNKLADLFFKWIGWL